MRKEIKFGIIGVVVTIIGLSAFFLASLFISTEISEPLPEGVNVSAPLPSNQIQKFLVMSEEKKT